MYTFEKMLKIFATSKTDFYHLDFQDKLGGACDIHVPIPVLRGENDYCIQALVYHLWASMYASQPYQIIQVCNSTVEYIDCYDISHLENWKGPILDQEFEDLEERLLILSEEVFECYLQGTYSLAVKEYAQKFFRITAPEFLIYYEKMSRRFIDWLRDMEST